MNELEAYRALEAAVRLHVSKYTLEVQRALTALDAARQGEPVVLKGSFADCPPDCVEPEYRAACVARSPSGRYLCSRAAGHGGVHHAHHVEYPLLEAWEAEAPK